MATRRVGLAALCGVVTMLAVAHDAASARGGASLSRPVAPRSSTRGVSSWLGLASWLPGLSVGAGPADARLANSTYPRKQAGNLSTSLTTAPGISAQVAWTFTTPGGGNLHSAAVGADGTVYVGSGNKVVYALTGVNSATPSVRWSQTLGGYATTTPVLDANGILYIACTDKVVYALDTTSNGAISWTFPAPDFVYSTPAAASDGTVVFGCNDSKVYALKGNGTATPDTVWTYTTGGKVGSSPAIGTTGLVYVGSDDGKLYALTPGVGSATVAWSWTAPASSPFQGRSPSVAADGTVYVVANGSQVTALKAPGSVVWTYTLGSSANGSPAIASDGTIYVGCQDKKLYALTYGGGPNATLKWSYLTGGVVFDAPAVGADGTVYAASYDGNVYALRSSGGPSPTVVWTHNTGGSSNLFASPTLCSDGTLYVTAADNKVHGLVMHDLLPSGLATNPATVVVGSPVTFTATVTNQGTCDIPGNFTVGLYLNRATPPTAVDTPDATVIVPSLAAGASTPVTFANQLYASAGAVTAWVFADSNAGIYEYDTTNNAISLAVDVKDPNAGLASSPWPKFHRDAYNRGYGTGLGTGVGWTYPTGGLPNCSPAIDSDGTIYMGANTSKLYALKSNGTATPTLSWSFSAGGSPSPPVIGADGTVYFGAASKVWAVKPNGTATPTLVWSYTTGGAIVGAPAVGADGTVYVGSRDKKVYALKANGTATPDVVWSYTTGNWVDTSPMVGPDGTVYVGSWDGKIYALLGNGTATPTVSWTYSATVQGALVLGADGTVYAGSSGNRVYALKGNGTSTPTLVWSYTTGGTVTAGLALGLDGVVYVPCQDKKLYALQPNGTSTPTLLWSYTTGGNLTTTPAIGLDNTVYVGSLDSRVYALRYNGTTTPTVVWNYLTGGQIWSSPALGPDGMLYFGSYDGSIYGLAMQDLQPTTPVPSSTSPVAGAAITVTTTVTNNGTTDIVTPFKVGLYLNSAAAPTTSSTPDYTLTVPSLAAGTSLPLTFTNVTYGSAGSATLWVMADAQGAVSEYLETNNTASTSVNVLDPEGGLANSAWPKFHRNTRNGGVGSGQGSLGRLNWSLATAGAIYGAPALGADGTVYVGSDDNSIYALKDNGTPDPTVAWSFATGNWVDATPVVGADGTVYIGSYDGTLYALKANGSATPDVVWSYGTNGQIAAGATIGPDGVVYVGATDGTVYALQDSGGPTPTLVWSYTTGGAIYTVPALAPDGTLYVGSDDGSVYALRGNGTGTPTVVWSFVTGDWVESSPTVGSDGTVYVGSSDATVYALKANGTTTPDVVWSYATGGAVTSSPALAADGTVYVGSADGSVYALKANGSTTPTVVWTYSAGTSIASSPTVAADGTVYVGSDDTNVYALRANGTATPDVVWTYPAGQSVAASSAIGADGTVYIGATDGTVFALNHGSLDLTPTALTPSTTTPGLGASFSVDVTVTNQGTGDVTGPFVVGLYKDRATAPTTGVTPDATQTVTSLAAGASTVVTFTGLSYATPGNPRMWVLVDRGAAITETDETNNTRSCDLSVAIADLTVTKILPSNTSPVLGVPFNVTATVANQGTADIAAPFTVGLYLDRATAPTTADTPDATATINSLAVGANTSVTFSNLGYGSLGNYTLWVLADSGGVVTEFDYTNNAASLALSVVDANAGLAASAWPKFCRTAFNTALGIGYASAGKLQWSYGTGGLLTSSPAIGVDGTVYFGSNDSRVYAVKPNGTATPTLVWSYLTGGAVTSSPTVGADGTVYVGSYDRRVYALKANGTTTPTVVWSYPTGNAVTSSPAIGADGTVYAGSADKKVYALKANGTSTPTLVWSFATSSSVASSPAVAGDGTVYIGSSDSKLYALKGNGTATPTLVWSYPTGGSITSTPTLATDGTVYVGSSDKKVYAFKANGSTVPTVVWTYTTGGVVPSSCSIGPDGTVYVGSYDGKVYALKGNGTLYPSVVWSYATGGAVYSVPALGPDGTVYVGSYDKKVYALQPNGTTTPSVLWSYTTGGTVYTSPALGADGTIYIGSNDTKLYALGTSTQPSLLVTSLTSSTPTPIVGVPCTVQATIKNAGASAIGGSFNVGLYLNRVTAPTTQTVPDFTAPVAGLGAGASTTVTFNSVTYATAGSVTLWALADCAGSVTQADTTNNAASLALTAIAPDLACTAVTPSTTTPVQNAPFSVQATVKNQGNLAIAAPFTLGVYLNRATAPTTSDTPDATQTVASLAVGASTTVTFSGLSYAVTGSQKVWVLVDSGNVVPEANETNNTLSASVSVLSPNAGLASGAWPRFHQNAFNTGLGVGQGSAGKLNWSYTTGAAVTSSSPALGADGTVYVGSDDNKVYALKANNTATPTVVWSYNTTGLVRTAPSVGADGTVYVGSDSKRVYALKANGTSTPALLWVYLTLGAVRTSPAVGPDGIVYIGSDDQSVYALKYNGTSSPTVVWTYATGGVVESSPAIGADGTVYVGSADGKVYALKANGTTTPTVVWSYATGSAVYSSPALGSDGTVYIGSADHKVYALKDNGTATPTVVWSFTTGGAVNSSPALGADGTVYVGSADKKVYALKGNGTATPTLVWRYTTGGAVSSSPAVAADGTVYCGSADGLVYAFVANLTTTPTVAWSYTTGAALGGSSPAIGADGTVYVGSGDTKVYALGTGVDLLVTALNPSTTSPPQDAAFSVQATIKNQGATDITVPFNVGLYLNRASAPTTSVTPDATQTVSSLAAGASTTVTFSTPSYATYGSATLWVLADCGAAVLEFDETNNTASKAMSVIQVNHAPVLSLPATQTTPLNTPLVLGGASALGATDVDAGTGALKATLFATNGTVTLAQTTGLTFLTGHANGGANPSFTGTLAALNAALNGLTFTPTTGFGGLALLQLSVNDQGNTGTGGALQATRTLRIWVASPGGVVTCWGDNTYGQSTVPAGLKTALAVAGGQKHTLALKADQTVQAWGNNGSGQLSVPGGLTGVVAVAAGYAHSLALKADGTVVAWGSNSSGQCTVPGGLTDVVAIAAGWAHSAALKGDGTVVCWGNNAYGQSTVPASPGTVAGLGVGGYHTLALRNDGTVVGWGQNGSHQSDGGAALGGLVAVTGGASSSLGRLSDGSVTAWGSGLTAPSGTFTALAATDAHGLGLTTAQGVTCFGGNTKGESTPPALAQVAGVGAGQYHSAAIGLQGPTALALSPSVLADGQAAGTAVGALTTTDPNLGATFTYTLVSGTGSTDNALFAINGSTLQTAAVLNWVDHPTCAVRVRSTDNLGLTVEQAFTVTLTHTNQAPVNTLPTARTTPFNTALVLSGANAVSISDADAGSNPVKVTLFATNGTVTLSQTTGLTFVGAHPNGGANPSFTGSVANINAALAGLTFTPTNGFAGLALLQVTTNDQGYGGTSGTPQQVTSTLRIWVNSTGGSVTAWGDNTYGQSAPPAGLTTAVAVAAGQKHSLALKANQTVVAWGNGGSGQTSVPAGLTGVVAIAAGYAHSLALKADGTVVAWGSNSSGQATVPGGLTDVVAIAAGWAHSAALKGDGTVVCWGNNLYGQSTVPASPGTLAGLGVGGYHTLAVRNDGTVVGWGQNTAYQSTGGSAVTGALAVTGGATSSVAVKADGSLTIWGSGLTGAGGPFAQLSAEDGHAVGVTIGRTVACFGSNTKGESTPPVLAQVLAVAAGQYHSLAITLAPGLSVTLSATPVSPAAVGTSVTLTATLGTQNPAAQYQFLASADGGKTLQLVQDWSTANTAPWVPAVAQTYTLYVNVRAATATGNASAAFVVNPS